MTDTVFYKNIWLKREHYCAECSSFLGSERQAVFFSHVLAKSIFPKLRHIEENIDLLCFPCHQIWEFGDKTTLVVYDEDKILRLKLLDRQLGKQIKMRA